MKYGIMESFRMHHSQMDYGLSCDSDRTSLFAKAGELGFHGIEFGIDLDYRDDPLWTGEGNLHKAMKKASQETGVESASVCLHLLNYAENSPASIEAEYRETGNEIIWKTIEACANISASVILVPFFGTAALKSEEQIQNAISEMKKLSPIAEKKGVCLGLETALEAPDMIRIVDSIGSECVQVYFDTGNTAGMDGDVVKEIDELGDRIVQSHIKDNPSGTLGKGDIDFAAAIGALKKVDFKGYLMLETPSTDYPIAGAKSNLDYIKNIVANS